MARLIRIRESIQILVEGKSPQNFFDAFARHLRLPNMPQIQDFGGVSELRGFLGSFVRTPKFDTGNSIGIVRDAEECAASAFQSVTNSLLHAGLPAPEAPGEIGAHSSSGLAVRVLILPGDGKPGMLETLLCRSIADASANRCIDDFLDCANSLPNSAIRTPDKARAQIDLATQPLPQVSVGVAAKKGYWRLDHEAFAKVRSFLTAL